MADYFWNDFDLKKPPLITLEVQDTGFAKHIFVAINRYLQKLSDSDFNETAALIGRLMARRKNSFRGLPGFRSVCKLNSALCRLLRLDLPRELEHFRSVLPDICDGELAGDLPTRHSFEYILVRLLAFYHLQIRIRECCLSVASYFGQMLRQNFFMEYLTLLLAAVAKIHRFSLEQANSCAILYNQLQPQSTHFPQVEKHQFLSPQSHLPTQLPLIKVFEKSDEENLTPKFKPQPVITKVERAKLEAKSDVGTVIERSDLKPQKPKTELTLNTVEDVKRFIKQENKLRQQQPQSQHCVTKSIAKHEWLAAQKLFQSKLQAQEPAKALSIFRKFINSKIK